MSYEVLSVIDDPIVAEYDMFNAVAIVLGLAD